MTRLTNEQITSLTGQALADAVAERVMGWRWRLDYEGWEKPNGRIVCRWFPDIDNNDAARVMERIEKLGLTEQYIDAMHDLGRLVEADEWDWWLHTASPADRCRAALMAIQESENAE